MPALHRTLLSVLWIWARQGQKRPHPYGADVPQGGKDEDTHVLCVGLKQGGYVESHGQSGSLWRMAL